MLSGVGALAPPSVGVCHSKVPPRVGAGAVLGRVGTLASPSVGVLGLYLLSRKNYE